MSEDLPELTDLQVMLILKMALEYNANVLKSASFIYGQDIKQKYRQRLYKDFTKLAKDYSKQIQDILEYKDKS